MALFGKDVIETDLWRSSSWTIWVRSKSKDKHRVTQRRDSERDEEEEAARRRRWARELRSPEEGRRPWTRAEASRGPPLAPLKEVWPCWCSVLNPWYSEL